MTRTIKYQQEILSKKITFSEEKSMKRAKGGYAT
jgi:hypothetical protein